MELYMKAILTATLAIASLNYVNYETKNLNKIFEELEYPQTQKERTISKFSWSKTDVKINAETKALIEDIKDQQETRSFLQF
jgi:hypothetical protein